MADRTFPKLSDYYKYIEKEMVINLEQIGEEIKGYLRTLILTDWYHEHMPTYYERTEMLINSLKVTKAKKVNDKYEVKVYFDPDMIKPVPAQEAGMFPAHSNITDGASSWGGKSYGELLPLWIEEGQKSRIYPYNGIGMVKETRETLLNEDEYLKVRMMELLELKDIICV